VTLQFLCLLLTGFHNGFGSSFSKLPVARSDCLSGCFFSSWSASCLAGFHHSPVIPHLFQQSDQMTTKTIGFKTFKICPFFVKYFTAIADCSYLLHKIH